MDLAQFTMEHEEDGMGDNVENMRVRGSLCSYITEGIQRLIQNINVLSYVVATFNKAAKDSELKCERCEIFLQDVKCQIDLIKLESTPLCDVVSNLNANEQYVKQKDLNFEHDLISDALLNDKEDASVVISKSYNGEKELLRKMVKQRHSENNELRKERNEYQNRLYRETERNKLAIEEFEKSSRSKDNEIQSLKKNISDLQMCMEIEKKKTAYMEQLEEDITRQTVVVNKIISVRQNIVGVKKALKKVMKDKGKYESKSTNAKRTGTKEKLIQVIERLQTLESKLFYEMEQFDFKNLPKNSQNCLIYQNLISDDTDVLENFEAEILNAAITTGNDNGNENMTLNEMKQNSHDKNLKMKNQRFS